MSVIEEIAAERKRQIEVEGWTAEHDEQHELGEIADAAACYASTERQLFHTWADGFHLVWKWDRCWFKRDKHPRRKQLIIAAALIVAEIERLDRESERSGGDAGE